MFGPVTIMVQVSTIDKIISQEKKIYFEFYKNIIQIFDYKSSFISWLRDNSQIV